MRDPNTIGRGLTPKLHHMYRYISIRLTYPNHKKQLELNRRVYVEQERIKGTEKESPIHTLSHR